MSEYPSTIYDPRTKENKSGVVYTPANTTQLYAEDVSKLDAEVIATQQDLGKKVVEIKIFSDDTALTTGDGKLIFCVPEKLNGMYLYTADCFITTVSSSGAIDIEVRNVTDSVDMLTTGINIDVGDYSSYESESPGEIDTDNNQVATGDLIAIDIDGAGTGAKGLGVVLVFYIIQIT